MRYKTNNFTQTLTNFPQEFHALPFPQNEEGDKIIDASSISALSKSQQKLAIDTIIEKHTPWKGLIEESIQHLKQSTQNQSFLSAFLPSRLTISEQQLAKATLAQYQIYEDENPQPEDIAEIKTALEVLNKTNNTDNQYFQAKAIRLLNQHDNQNYFELLKTTKLNLEDAVSEAYDASPYGDDKLFELSNVVCMLTADLDNELTEDQAEMIHYVASHLDEADQRRIDLVEKLVANKYEPVMGEHKTNEAKIELSRYKYNDSLSEKVNFLLRDFTVAFNEKNHEELFELGAQASNLDNQERKALKGGIMSILLTSNTELFNRFNHEIDSMVLANQITDPILKDLYNQEFDTHNAPHLPMELMKIQQKKIRHYLSTTLLTAPNDLNIEHILPSLVAHIKNPEQDYIGLPLFNHHNNAVTENLRGSIVSRLRNINNGAENAKELEISRWFELFIENASKEDLQKYADTPEQYLTQVLVKDINNAAQSLTDRTPFQGKVGNWVGTDKYNDKGGVSDIAFAYNGQFYASDVSLANGSQWEGNQFIRHHSDIVDAAINSAAPKSSNPLKADNGNFKETITKQDMRDFLELSKKLKVNYSIVPTIGAGRNDAHTSEKAAAYLISSQLHHAQIGGTTVEANAIHEYFADLDFKVNHQYTEYNYPNSVYLNTTNVKNTLQNFQERILKKDPSINWKKSNAQNRINLAEARLATLGTLFKELQDSDNNIEQSLRNMGIEPTEDLVSKLKEPDYFKTFATDTKQNSSKSEKIGQINQHINDRAQLLNQSLARQPAITNHPPNYLAALEDIKYGDLVGAASSLVKTYKREGYKPAIDKLVDLAIQYPDEGNDSALEALMELYDDSNTLSKEVAFAFYQVISVKEPSCAQEYLEKAIELGYVTDHHPVDTKKSSL